MEFYYYTGNMAGYVDSGKAVVDPLPDMDGGISFLKACRIHQLKPEVDVMMKFIGYDELLERFGEPNQENYRVVYDGQLET